MRALALSFLTLLTLVTSVGLGFARGMLPPTDAVVICRGHVALTIWLDADGNEVEAAHLCAEAALALLTQPASPAPVPGHPVDRLLLLTGQDWVAPAAHAVAPPPTARGPPVLI